MKEGQLVIVIDTSNYNSEYSENTPFKAELYVITDYSCFLVRSLNTGKKYELYENQILEGLHIEEIANLLDMSKYGE